MLLVGCSEISMSAAFKRLNSAAHYATCRITQYIGHRIHAQPICNSRHNYAIKIFQKSYFKISCTFRFLGSVSKSCFKNKKNLPFEFLLADYCNWSKEGTFVCLRMDLLPIRNIFFCKLRKIKLYWQMDSLNFTIQKVSQQCWNQ